MDRAKPFNTTYGKLFTAIDGGWVIRNGWVFSPTFKEDIAQLLEEEKNEYGLLSSTMRLPNLALANACSMSI
ncbi:hypothetical protein Q9G90_12365 [Corynebacterium stationis]|uniref:hypothetical protein n=1 Tax=Corynebacterium stationis TaxID=1705 RepID=UPI00273BE2A3|nr:hypothetical protein [Corynebacterium stationis]WLP87068.1 hypothetical protein Q9G90_12365 [Corynebacterium stationis]